MSVSAVGVKSSNRIESVLVALYGDQAINRLKRIEGLSLKIKERCEKIRSMAGKLSDGPPDVMAEIPWLQNKVVPIKKAISLYQKRRLKFVPQVLSGKMTELEYSQKIEEPCVLFFRTFYPKIKEYKQSIYKSLEVNSPNETITGLSKQLKKEMIEFAANNYPIFHRTGRINHKDCQQKIDDFVKPRLLHMSSAANRLKSYLRACVKRTNPKVQGVLKEIKRIQDLFDRHLRMQKMVLPLDMEYQSSRDQLKELDNDLLSVRDALCQLKEIKKNSLPNGRVAYALNKAFEKARLMPEVSYSVRPLVEKLDSFYGIFYEMSEDVAIESQGWEDLFARDYVSNWDFEKVMQGFNKFKDKLSSHSRAYDELSKELQGFAAQIPEDRKAKGKNIELTRSLMIKTVQQYSESLEGYGKARY
jgi:hypothetical protein